jgi:uncharacterized protein (DUF1800 family)
MSTQSLFKNTLVAIAMSVVALARLGAQDVPADFEAISVAGSNVTFKLKPYLNADQLRMLRANQPGGPYTVIPGNLQNNGGWNGYDWQTNTTPASQFYKAQITPLNSNLVWAANLLNRAAYGPSPDDWQNITNIGPLAWINEQIDPAFISDVTGTNGHTNILFIQGRMATNFNVVILTNETQGAGSGDFHHLQAWFVQKAVNSKRQLLEVLSQFCENLFVTQGAKLRDFFSGPYNGVPNMANRLASNLEYQEMIRWRQALLDPQCTFETLLKISADSPAQIIYLDTQTSRGDGANVANENYAREIMELYSMGVDNGYEQIDITQMSPVWTGWNCRFVATTNWSNRFAGDNPLPNGPPNTISNNVGVWALNYRFDRHGVGNKFMFFTWNSNLTTITGKKSIPARFGPPWTTQAYTSNPYSTNSAGQYSLFVPAGTAGNGLNGTNGVQEGYWVVNHLAKLPFTQEFISAKLCRIFVHDDFPFGEADGFDFNDANSSAPNHYSKSPEGRLMKQCMLAWETNTPKGQIYKVVETILKSDLFKQSGGQKVKTPFEFTVSAIRAFRIATNSVNPAGTWSADTDGYAIGAGNSAFNTSHPMNRMGQMLLFNRETPDGYPEYAEGWVSAGTLAERSRFAQTFLMQVGDANKADGISGGNNNVSDPVGVINARLSGSARFDARQVADLFLGMLFPGEGRANLHLYRRLAEDHLNTPVNSMIIGGGSGTETLDSLTDTQSAEYQTRVRGMVALLMVQQRFQEQ